MKKNSIYLLSLLIILLLIGGIIVGCEREDISIGEEKEEDELALDVGGKDDDILVRSENIANLVVNQYGIDNATSIIFNDIAVIGLELADGSELDADMEKTIRNVVLENDTIIKEVLITDNSRLFSRIERVVLSLLNGKPYDDQVKEIDKIIEKLKKK